MFIQGDLQAVFDALYSLGAIDPVLKEDWKQLSDEIARSPQDYCQALTLINSCAGNRDEIVQKLAAFDRKTINCIAVEVARELAEFTDRKTLH
ncbi:MAG: cytochrome [Bdellovibrio sp.]|nr:MAG: cytochrome [Bdellovibrio sp.]